MKTVRHFNKETEEETNKNILRTSLVVQRLRLPAPHAGGLGSISGQGTRYHMLQLKKRSHVLQLIPSTVK